MVVRPMSGESKVTCGSKNIQIRHHMRHVSRLVEVSMRGQRRVTNSVDAMKNNVVFTVTMWRKFISEGIVSSDTGTVRLGEGHKKSTKHGEELS
jgi:hypothetical protein